MAKKPTARSEFVMFDVIYEDGSQRSNRKVRRAGPRGHHGTGSRHLGKIRPAAPGDQDDQAERKVVASVRREIEPEKSGNFS